MTRIPWYINSRPYRFEGGGDIFVGTQNEADRYAQSVGQHAGNQVSGVRNGLVRNAVDDKGNPITMDGEQVYANPYLLDGVTVKAPNLQVAKAARERPDYRGLNGFANAAVGGLAGLAGYYGGQLWNSAWKAGVGDDWATSVLNGVNRIGDETGLYHVDPNNRYAQFGAGLTNPGIWFGGAAAARTLGRSSIMGAQEESLVSTKGLNYRDVMASDRAEGQLNPNSANAYTYKSGYGYRLTKPNKPVEVKLSAPHAGSSDKKAQAFPLRKSDFKKDTRKRPSDRFNFEKYTPRKFNFRKDYERDPFRFDFKKEPVTKRTKAESWLIDHGLGWLVKDEDGHFGF